MLSGEKPASLPLVVGPDVSGLAAALEDEVHPLPGGRLVWSTAWVLRWEPYPEALAYELQALTGEGALPKLCRQREPYLRIQVAANENDQCEGLRDRDIQLALHVGQLAYQVRAVLRTGSVSAWSLPMAVGKVTDL